MLREKESAFNSEINAITFEKMNKINNCVTLVCLVYIM